MPIWCVVLVFECQVSEIVTSKDFVCTQFKKNCNINDEYINDPAQT